MAMSYDSPSEAAVMAERIGVDHDVPIPVGAKSKRGRPPKYPWADLEVGDSFFVKGKRPIDLGEITQRMARRTGFRFITRTVQGGVRVWRIT